MGSQEFAQAVRGSGAEPISTTSESSFETDNYGNGQGFDKDGSAYPYTIDPTFDIQVVHITQADNITMKVTTIQGYTFDVPLAGGTGVIDHISMDKVEFTDPNNTGARISGFVGGE